MSAFDFVKSQIQRARQDFKAAQVLAEWIGSDADPVTPGVASSRAMQCIGCPGRHNKFDHRRLEPGIAEAIRVQESMRRHVSLKTPQDPRLHSCLDTAAGPGCGCYLKLKVWVPIENQPDTKMPAYCWVTKERQEKAVPLQAVTSPSVTAPVKPVQAPPVRMVVIERNAAIGDVVMATAIATALHRQGIKAGLRCAKGVREMLQGHPHLKVVTDDSEATVKLDACYELEPNRRSMHRRDNYLWTAKGQLKPHGIELECKQLPAPVLTVTDRERASAITEIGDRPRPWIAVNPKSGAWVNRSVSPKMCAKLAPMLPGTPIWIGTDPAPKGYVALPVGSIRTLMARIAVCDAVVTTDTGPLHIALALRVPTTLIAGPFKQDTFLPPSGEDGVLWNAVSVPLPCIGCCDYVCREVRKGDTPPCTEIDPKAVAAAVTRLLEFAPGSKRATVSVVIPVYRPAPRLGRCIKALPAGVEVIVSSDGVDGVKPIDGVTTVASLGRRTGFGATCNRGAAVAHGKFILFLNDDCYLDPGAVDAMVSAMEGDVAVVGCLTRYPDDRIYHGGTVRSRTGYGHLDWGKREPSVRTVTEMEFVNFAAVLVRKSAFDEVGGFSPDYDTYCEDSDLCLRLRQKGWKVMYQPAATGVHDEAQSTGAMKGELHAKAKTVFDRMWSWYFNGNELGKLGTFEHDNH